MTDENKRLKEDLALLKKDYGIEVELYDPEEQPCCRRKHREPDESAALINRLNRIEGQVRGVRKMNPTPIARISWCRSAPSARPSTPSAGSCWASISAPAWRRISKTAGRKPLTN